MKRFRFSSCARLFRGLSSRPYIDLPHIRQINQSDIANIVEVKQRDEFYSHLCNDTTPCNESDVKQFLESGMSFDEMKMVIDAGLITFLLHVESRVASSVGQGFYTIGPCGEELLGLVGLHLRETDPTALHYRHVAMSVLRQLKLGRSIEDIIKDRARGFTCSTNDPVTGGRHCAIGGTPYDFIVTSTLASQAPPAVGRALAIPLTSRLRNYSRMLETNPEQKNKCTPLEPTFPQDAVSLVSVGEGSVNNAHFLSALNLAEYSQYHKKKCPIVFLVSDNGMCISLRDQGWINSGSVSRLNMRRLTADGSKVSDLYMKSREAINYARSIGRPVLLLVKNLRRRFGHAATDRQFAYMAASEIQEAACTNHLFNATAIAKELGIYEGGKDALAERFKYIWECTEKAFDEAVNEPKITDRTSLVASNSPPVAPYSYAYPHSNYSGIGVKGRGGTGKVDSMRKHMTRIFDEALDGKTAAADRVVYVGEDVRHGGYYLVTDGLYSKYPARVHDFPPDETTLLGAGHGFSQAGLVPIVEIPYAKYLDCGADMFYEIAITHWLTNGKQRNGMIIRVQGFDRGKFGGNFHTHNLIHTPPGVDVVCFSNGADYVRGMRYALRQAALSGRIVMFMDSTDLLNRRHLGTESDSSGVRDDAWLTVYPEAQKGEKNGDLEMTFEDVVVYRGDWAEQGGTLFRGEDGKDAGDGEVLIVSYGNGLPSALQAMRRIIDSNILTAADIAVVDCPYLSHPPAALQTILSAGKQEGRGFKHVVFADVCKTGAGMVFGGFVVNLKSDGLLPSSWEVVGAQPTYNPLGQTLTFLNSEDIQQAVERLVN